MNNLSEEIEKVKSKIKMVLKSDRCEENLELANKLDLSNTNLHFSQNHIKQREAAKQFLSSIKKNIEPVYELNKPIDLSKCKLLNINYEFSQLRFISVCGYLASNWGIYDNLGISLKIILAIDEDPKFKNSLVDLLINNNLPLSGHIKKLIRSRYEVSIGISYQIRNIFLHGDKMLNSDIFQSGSVQDGFKLNSQFSEVISKLCQERKDIRNIKERGKNFFKIPSRCLIDLLFQLELETDEMASRLLHEGIQTLLPVQNFDPS